MHGHRDTNWRVATGIAADRGVSGKFFWGGKVIFPYFFPAWNAFFRIENFHFGTPKTNFTPFEKWKVKKKKKKKKSPLLILLIYFSHFEKWKAKKKKGPLLIWKFSLLPFSIFLLPFQFFPCHFFLVGQQKFPGQKSLGEHSVPPPVTPLAADWPLELKLCPTLRMVLTSDASLQHASISAMSLCTCTSISPQTDNNTRIGLLHHTPPVEDFVNVNHRGSVRFQMQLPSVWFPN